MVSCVPVLFHKKWRDRKRASKHSETAERCQRFADVPRQRHDQIGITEDGRQSEKSWQPQHHATLDSELLQRLLQQLLSGARDDADMSLSLIVRERQSLSDPRVPRTSEADEILPKQCLLVETGLEAWNEADRKIGFSRLQRLGHQIVDARGLESHARRRLAHGRKNLG